MNIEVNEQGIVTVTYNQPSAARVRALIDGLKEKHGIKNMLEIAKLFGLKPDSGKRSVISWCSDESKKNHLPIPQAHYELLLLLESGAVPIKSTSKVTHKPKRVSKQMILSAVCERFKINPEYIGMDKSEGEYYWTGKLACLFHGTCTHIAKLNDLTLERWVELFEYELYRAGLLDKDINQHVESIDWDID